MRIGLQFLLAFAALLVSGALTKPAWAERRIALVVGIDAYPNLDADMHLQRAVADANSVSNGLAKIGFSVTTLSTGPEVTDDYFEQRLSRFAQTVQQGDIVVFYFAGHGVGLDGANYLVPADMPQLEDNNPYMLQKHAISEAEIRDLILRHGPRVVVLLLDACRNNPFRSTDRGLPLTRGLQPLEASSDGVLAIYAAAYGKVAFDRLSDSDDANPNSVFTRVLVSELKRPDLNLVDFSEDLKEKVAEIARKAGRDQVPAVDSELLRGRDIYLSAPVASPEASSPDEIAWSSVRGTSDADILRRFLAQFPDSKRRGEAEARLASLDNSAPAPSALLPPPTDASPDEVAWGKAASSTPADVRVFIDRFPHSPHRVDAEKWLRFLDDSTWHDAPSSDAAAQRHYLELFPAGLHSAQSRGLLATLEQPRAAPEHTAPHPVPRALRSVHAPVVHAARPERPRHVEVAVRYAPHRLERPHVYRAAAGLERRHSGGCFVFAGEGHCQ